jgi:hypothetical protein
MPRIVAIYRNDQGVHEALVVGDAVWCGVCHPKEDPVDLPELR